MAERLRKKAELQQKSKSVSAERTKQKGLQQSSKEERKNEVKRRKEMMEGNEEK